MAVLGCTWRRIRAALGVAVLLSWPLSGQAKSLSADIGSEHFSIPTPVGMSDVQASHPNMFDMQASQLKKGRLIAYFANSDELDSLKIKHYMMAGTGRAYEQMNLSLRDFETVRKQIGAAEKREETQQHSDEAHNNTWQDRLKDYNRDGLLEKLSVGTAKDLGIVNESQNVISAMRIARNHYKLADDDERDLLVASVVSTVWARGKMLVLSTFCVLDNQDDRVGIEWTRSANLEWVRATLAENR